MKAEDKIYQAFFELKENKLYYNQLKERTELSHSSLQNAINKLTNLNILKQEKTKSNTFYIILNKKLLSLKFSEIAIKQFNNLNIRIKNPLRNFLKNISQEVYTVVLFGSASRGEEQKDSDIDLLIVMNREIDLSNNKKDAEITSKYPISIFQATIEQFLKNEDDMIIQARKTGFPIYKEQNFYEAIFDEY
ncbi:MAG: nucleotidyltransferase domain-containing protein [archaeon]